MKKFELFQVCHAPVIFGNYHTHWYKLLLWLQIDVSEGKIIKQVIALYDYEGAEPGDLSLTKVSLDLSSTIIQTTYMGTLFVV